MSTLLEIEAADDALPLKQKKKLLDFVAARINGGAAKKPSDYAGRIRRNLASARGPAPPGSSACAASGSDPIHDR